MLLFRRLRPDAVSLAGSVVPAVAPWLIPAVLMAAGILAGSVAGSPDPAVPPAVPHASVAHDAEPVGVVEPSPASALVLVASRFGIDPVRFLVLSEFVSSQGWSGSGLFRYKEGDPLPAPLPLGREGMDVTSAYVAADQIASLVSHGWDEVDAMLFFCFGPSWDSPSQAQSTLRSALMLPEAIPEGTAASGAACEVLP